MIAANAREALAGSTPTTLKAHVYQLLREAIVGGVYKPGTRLNESKLAREFNISRIPIREALLQLREHGLVMSHERRGMFVTELAAEDVQRINSLRVVLEAEALRLCKPRMTRQVAAKLTSLVDRMDKAGASTEIDSASLDLEFHRTIWQAAGNPYLAKTLDSLSTVLFAHTALRSTAKESQPWRLNHHRELLDVALGRSEMAPEQAVINHLRVHYDQPEKFSSYAEDAKVTGPGSPKADA
jgi:DNA-binding GntR family transcriptional regulator